MICSASLFVKKFRTYQLAKELFKRTRHLTFSFMIKEQFDRAMLSVVLNLAEGAAKSSAKDRRRFFSVAMGSLREVQAILEISNYDELTNEADKLGAHIHKLILNPGHNLTH